MAMTGMDIEQVRQLATQLNKAGEDVRQIAAQLTSKLGSTTWVGADQQQFTGDWHGTHQPALNQVADALGQAAQKATQNASEQESTSAR